MTCLSFAKAQILNVNNHHGCICFATSAIVVCKYKCVSVHGAIYSEIQRTNKNLGERHRE